MIRYKYPTTVRYVAPEKERLYKSGFGPDAQFYEQETGRFMVSLEGVGILIMIDKVEFKPGDSINLILEGPIDAKSEQPPVRGVHQASSDGRLQVGKDGRPGKPGDAG
jgi:hypothetical protein